MVVRLPSRSPNLNANLERFMGWIKAECLDRKIIFGERALQSATTSLFRALSIMQSTITRGSGTV